MANHVSAAKRARTSLKRQGINRARKSRIKTFLKNVEAAISEGNLEKALSAFKIAQPEIDRSVAKGIMHKNAASRKKSRLTARIKTLQ